MEIYTIQRPSLLPTAACAPSASWLSESAPVALLVAERAVAERAVASQVHQVQVQAELAAALVGTDESYGTGESYGITGLNVDRAFVGSNVAAGLAKKRMTVGGSGVPPRGRPV